MPFDLRPQRLELLIRIILQNLLLLMAVASFGAAALAGLAWPDHAWIAASVHAVISGALLLQWCHHGVRTMQIKRFIVEREGVLADAWETWLPAHRPERLLGTRWLISTKGVFLGLQAAMGIHAASLTGAVEPWFAAFCTASFLVSFGLLFTNPKE